MNLREYQSSAKETAVYPHIPAYPIIGVMYAGLGLAGETGEVTEQIKKSWRNNMEITPERKDKIEDELGDVMWYAAQIATELGLDLEKIAELNLGKLAARQNHGLLKHHS